MYEALTTLEDVKGWLEIPTATTSQDGRLDGLIEAISETIGRFCARDNLGSVEAYTEIYDLPARYQYASIKDPKIVLEHYPVRSITTVQQGQVLFPVLTDPTTLGTVRGVWLETDKRIIRIYGLPSWDVSPVVITYTAGYAEVDIPPGLKQAANMMIGEIYKSKDWIGFTSKSLANETVSFEQGKKWAMSPRVVAMLQPYVNRIPVRGSGA